MKKNLISFRPSENVRCRIDDIMEKQGVNQTEAIEYLVLSSDENSGICGKSSKGKVIKYITDTETVLSRMNQTENVDKLWNGLEEFKCQIL